MDRRKQEALDWLAAQVVVAKADGGMMQSGAIYEALKVTFPDNPMTMDEVCEALVEIADRGDIAVEFDERASG